MSKHLLSSGQIDPVEPLTVRLIEDDTELRDALGSLLSSFGLDHLSYDSPAAFLNSLPFSGGGCLVIDIRMPGMSGIDLVKELRLRKIPLPIILMTAHADVPVTIQAFKLGAVEFLQKPFASHTFITAVRNAVKLDRSRLERLATAKSLRETIATLTKKDWEVIALLRQGHPNKRVAAALGITERAIEMRRASMLKKTCVSNFTELISLVTQFEMHRLQTADSPENL